MMVVYQANESILRKTVTDSEAFLSGSSIYYSLGTQFDKLSISIASMIAHLSPYFSTNRRSLCRGPVHAESSYLDAKL